MVVQLWQWLCLLHSSIMSMDITSIILDNFQIKSALILPDSSSLEVMIKLISSGFFFNVGGYEKKIWKRRCWFLHQIPFPVIYFVKLLIYLIESDLSVYSLVLYFYWVRSSLNYEMFEGLFIYLLCTIVNQPH